MNYAQFIEDYQDDIPDSDNEMDLYEDDERIKEANYTAIVYNDVLEEFYAEILSWLVDPNEHNTPGHINSYPSFNAKWIFQYFQNQGRHIMDQVTNASTLQEYSRHMKAVLMLNVRANVNMALGEEHFRDMQTNPKAFMTDLYDGNLEQPRFTEIEITSVAASSELLHLTASSEDKELNRDIYNRYLKGLTLCLARIERPKGSRLCPIPKNSSRTHENSSGLVFMLIRRVSLLNFDGDKLERDT